MFSIYDLHGQKVKRHDLQVHKHGRWDDSINMAAQWPSLHAANPPKMASTKSTSTNIVESKTVKDRLMLTNFLAANKNSSGGGASALLMNGLNSNSENAAARGDEGKQQRTAANNSAISSNDGENRVIACEQGSGKKCNN